MIARDCHSDVVIAGGGLCGGELSPGARQRDMPWSDPPEVMLSIMNARTYRGDRIRTCRFQKIPR